MIKALPSDLSLSPLSFCVIEIIARLNKKKQLAWSTISSLFSSFASALLSLPLYTNENYSIDLRKDPNFASAYSRAQKNARCSPSLSPTPSLSFQEFLNISNPKILRDPVLNIFFSISWYFAARIGDIRRKK